MTDFLDNPVNITSSDTYEMLPVWSSDGLQIAFLSSSSYTTWNKSRLYVMTLTTGDVRILSDLEFTSETTLTWSPNGRYIAAALDIIYIVDVENRNNWNLSVNCGSCSVNWLSDSSGLIIESLAELFRIDLDGKNREQIISAPPNAYRPELSPASNNVVFASDYDGISGLYNVNLDNLAITRIVGMPSYDIMGHEWSPDGHHLAFTVIPSYGSDITVPGGGDVYVVNSDGTDKRVLTGENSDGLIGWTNDSQHIFYYGGEIGSAGGSYYAVNITDLTQTLLSSEEMDEMCSYSNCRNFAMRPYELGANAYQ